MDALQPYAVDDLEADKAAAADGIVNHHDMYFMYNYPPDPVGSASRCLQFHEFQHTINDILEDSDPLDFEDSGLEDIVQAFLQEGMPKAYLLSLMMAIGSPFLGGAGIVKWALFCKRLLDGGAYIPESLRTKPSKPAYINNYAEWRREAFSRVAPEPEMEAMHQTANYWVADCAFSKHTGSPRDELTSTTEAWLWSEDEEDCCDEERMCFASDHGYAAFEQLIRDTPRRWSDGFQRRRFEGTEFFYSQRGQWLALASGTGLVPPDLDADVLNKRKTGAGNACEAALLTSVLFDSRVFRCVDSGSAEPMRYLSTFGGCIAKFLPKTLHCVLKPCAADVDPAFLNPSAFV